MSLFCDLVAERERERGRVRGGFCWQLDAITVKSDDTTFQSQEEKKKKEEKLVCVCVRARTGGKSLR